MNYIDKHCNITFFYSIFILERLILLLVAMYTSDIAYELKFHKTCILLF